MKLKFAAFLVAWLYIAPFLANAQTDFAIQGRLVSPQNQPLADVTIYLQNAIDSSVVKTAFSATDGKFAFNQLKSGSYRIVATNLGFQTYKSEIIELKENKILPDFKLQQQETMLKGVVVSGQKPLIEQKIDKTIVNVDALISVAGATALDVLEKSPGVLVDQNGAISLKGKSSITIFIDGKPTYLSGSELENYLRSLSASTIDQVELMSNPPAKYDAAGNGGVINIKTKKSKVKGFNGGVNLSYSQGKYGKTNNSGNFNYRNQKINLFGNLSFSTSNGFSDLDINRYFLNSGAKVSPNFLQNSFIRRTSETYNARIGMDYYATENTTFGVGLTGLINPSNENTRNVSNLFNAANALDSSIVALNQQKRSFQNGGANLNFRHQFGKKGGELTADLDYLNYSTDADQSFDNTSYLPNGAIKSNDLLTGSLPAAIHIFSGKADFTKELNNGYKLEAGVKTSYTQTDNIADYFIVKNQVTSPDYDKTNHFKYEEQINAAYLNLNKDFKRVSVQLGLRTENTSSNGHQLGNVQKPDSVFKRNYTGFFPTAYIQYKLDTTGNQSINLNYGKRIDRPYYQDLNPFLSPLDKFTYYTGNPFLKPSYSHNIELTHTYKKIATTLSYSRAKDEVNETIEIVDGIYYSRPGNLGRTITKGISVDGSFDLSKTLNLNVFARALNIHTISDFYTGELNTQGTFYFARAMFQQKLPKDWSIQVEGGYQSKVVNAQFVAGARGRVNFAVAKKLSPAATLKFVANDLFYTFINSGEIKNLANTRANYRNLNDSRTAVLSFSYRFGKAIADQRKHEANGAESEQGRVKN